LGDPFELVCVGSPGFGAAELLSLSQRSPVKDSVRFLDWIAEAELPAILSSASAYLFPSWYGVGFAFSRFLEEHPESNLSFLREMYREWEFFKAFVDNLQMVLIKTDMRIAEAYSALVQPPEIGKRMFAHIHQEYLRTRNMILQITEQKELLDSNKGLQTSLRLRNPYIDPISYIQIELLKKLRSGATLSDKDRTALMDNLRLTINGIAAGIRNTG
jgi:phosphoenolpyruvate carboxylase